MGNIVKFLGGVWIAVGLVCLAMNLSGWLAIPMSNVMPMSNTVFVLASVLAFVAYFLVPGTTLYCVGDLHHHLVAVVHKKQIDRNRPQRNKPFWVE